MGGKSIDAVADVVAERREENRRQFEEFQMINEKTVDTSNLFLKSALLVNGGSAVAVLGFVANIAKVKSDYSVLLVGVTDALLWFAWGVAASMVALSLAYLTHYANLVRINAGQEDKTWWDANKRIIHFLAAVVAVASIFCFLRGAYEVRGAVLMAWG